MQVIGLLGGMSWESTAVYCALLNRMVRERLGAHHSARLLMYAVDFQDLHDAQAVGDWEAAARLVEEGARRVEAGGADFALLCTNTMHKAFDRMQAAVSIPFLHLADATGRAIQAAGFRRVGLLGTRFTMEEAFYRDRLRDGFGIETLVPDAAARETVHRVIVDELVRGDLRDESRRAYVRIIGELAERGAEAVILGCTEIPLLVSQADVSVPVFDTTRIHCEAAVERALAGSPAPVPS
ncbi:MAG TPA: aspartate/glutamate racemase family protein [Longimicrobium sp.]|nr:aspartate/glutamate racemase family protein [Longimicrobium sp.]